MADSARGDAGVSGAQNLYHVAYGDGFSANTFLTGLFGVNRRYSRRRMAVRLSLFCILLVV